MTKGGRGAEQSTSHFLIDTPSLSAPLRPQSFDGDIHFCQIFSGEALHWLCGSHWRRNYADFQWIFNSISTD